MELAVIGAGHVGLTTAACLAEIGHTVFCADSDVATLDTLKAGQTTFFEPHLASIATRNSAAGRLTFTSPALTLRGPGNCSVGSLTSHSKMASWPPCLTSARSSICPRGRRRFHEPWQINVLQYPADFT